jgi:hypothetical protein
MHAGKLLHVVVCAVQRISSKALHMSALCLGVCWPQSVLVTRFCTALPACCCCSYVLRQPCLHFAALLLLLPQPACLPVVLPLRCLS